MPTMFTWRIRKLRWEGVGGEPDDESRTPGPKPIPVWAISAPAPNPPSRPALLPVVGEGVELRHYHGAGIGLVGELVNQQPLLSLPNHAYLQGEDTLRLAQAAGLRCLVPHFLTGQALCPQKVLIQPQGLEGHQVGSPSFRALKRDFKGDPRAILYQSLVECLTEKPTPLIPPQPGPGPSPSEPCGLVPRNLWV